MNFGNFSLLMGHAKNSRWWPNPKSEMVRQAVRQAHGPEQSRRTISNGGSGDPPYIFFSVGPVTVPAKKSSKFKLLFNLIFILTKGILIDRLINLSRGGAVR